MCSKYNNINRNVKYALVGLHGNLHSYIIGGNYLDMYEIEHRAVLTEETYKELAERLAREATLLGADDKEVSYYIFRDRLLKVVRNIT